MTMTRLLKHAAGMLAALLFTLPVWAIEVTKMVCETMTDPTGITSSAPRLGWQLRSEHRGDSQSAYRLVAASTREGAEALRGDLWESGTVKSNQSQWIPYAGKTPAGGTTVYWRVAVRDAKNKWSEWSDVATWEMAPAADELDARWIGAISREEARQPVGRRDFHQPSLRDSAVIAAWGAVPDLARRSILLRREVEVKKKVKSAVVYISGLGHYELTVNGQRVGDSQFAPLWSDYDKTVYYNTYHLENLLDDGKNVFGVMLGNGFYNVNGDRYRKLWIAFGPPTLFFQARVTYEDGTVEVVRSDDSWRWAESPVTFNDIFGGEDYDARLEQPGWDRPGFDDSRWRPAVVQGPPPGTLTPQLAPPVKIMRRYPVSSVKEQAPGVYVFDMGQNLSGFPTVAVQGRVGQTIRILVGESLRPEGTVDQRRTGSPYSFEYTLKGGGIERWTPRFSYYGYRYIQIEGADYLNGGGERPVVKELLSDFVYSSAAPAGTFESSNEIFNNAHRLIDYAIRSNMQAVFTDCPQREKLGWIEQVYLNGPGIFYNFDVGQLIPKSLQDMADGQRANGLVPSIVPEYTDFTAQSWGADFADSPEWGAAVCVSPWQYYEYYGDDSMIRKHYPNMCRYVDYLGTKATDYILSHGLGDWYDYGTHAAGRAMNSPTAIAATSHWYLSVQHTLRAAELTGDAAGVAKYTALAEKIAAAYNKEFYHPDTKQYATGSQFSNAVSIYLNLVPEADRQGVLNNLTADIRARGMRLTTGDIGNRYLFRVLADNGCNDVMFAMQNHTDAPGYGYQMAFGATTLTEQWDPSKGNSWNHFMLGQIEEWFYVYLAGIQSVDNSGFRKIRFAPQPVGELSYVRGTHESLYGTIVSEWRREGKRWTYTVEIPVNCTAEVVLPAGASDIRADGKPVPAGEFNLNAGRYTITCNLK